MNEEDIIYEPQRDSPVRSEEELYSQLIQPKARTSYQEVYQYDDVEKRVKKKARDLGVPELNLSDLTTAILVGGKATYEYAWHTINLINQLTHIQKATGYDVSALVRFFYDNVTCNLNLSKSSGGALIKAITTKEMRQINENRVYNAPEDDSPDAITKWWNRKKNQKQPSDGFK